MALTSIRTRLHTHLRCALSLSTFNRLPTTAPTTVLSRPLPSHHHKQNQVRHFHSTHPSLAQARSFNDMDQIHPDTILFEGCDYNHFLIVMDFGKDPKNYPPPEQMVETYVQTCAKVLGSVEEAKKKIYACSTTTYTGFQVEVDEETSKKFESLDGVVFVLPDSYIDPAIKEYGGDKFINGKIIPRPPPIQYVRMTDRRNDRRFRGSSSQQGNPADNQHGSMSGEGRGYMPQRDHYQNVGNTSPPPQQHNHNQDLPSRQENYNQMRTSQDHYNQMPTHQGNYNHGVPTNQGNYNHGIPTNQGNYNHGMPTHQGNYNRAVPTHQGNNNPGYTQPHQNFAGGYHGQINNRQGNDGYNHSQGQIRGNQGGYTPQGQAEYPATGRNYAPVPLASGADGQTGVGSFEQSGPGQYGQGPNGIYDEGASVADGSGNTYQIGGDQRFSQGPGLNRA